MNTMRHTIAPNAPSNSAIVASDWIANPGPRFSTALA